jgi:hypothetical protein
MAKYYVDAEGKYLGSFDGYQPPDEPVYGEGPLILDGKPVFEQRQVVKDGEPEFDEAGDPVMEPDLERPVMQYQIVAWEPQAFVMAPPPEGAIEVATPPEDGTDRWDGQAWQPDAAARKAAQPVTLEHVLAVLATKGISISESDLDAVK